MSNDLNGKTAFITGGARGIGAASAKFLAKKGASIVLADLDLEEAERAAAKLSAEGLNVMGLYLDVSATETIESVVEKVLNKFGQIDILVNNAGVLNSTPFLETDLKTWQRTLAINLTGAFACSRLILPVMINQKAGRIVNIASIAGLNGGPIVGPDYAASKAGLISLTKSLARVGAPHNITSNAICPGYILTDMTREREDNPASVPLKRLGTPLDIARVVYFFVSELGSYVTGTTLEVDGGLTMR